jgi:hypothetical protein
MQSLQSIWAIERTAIQNQIEALNEDLLTKESENKNLPA